jgi:streptogramin lyase
VYQGGTAPFIAEGIAHDTARNRILIAGIYTRSIVAIGDAQAVDFIASLPDGISPFALAIAGQTLWVAGGVTPQGNSNAPPLAALLSFDLATGRLQRTYKETSGSVKAFGDIALGHDGTVYLSDGDGGSIYRLRPGADLLERIGAGGQLLAPQGMVERPDGKMLLVADYALGLVRLDLMTGEIAAVTVPKDATTLVIDGLAQLDGRKFVATQNGIQPARIVRFTLNADWSAITRFEVIARAAPEIADPSLIVADGDGVLLVGVGQWASFDADKPQPVRPLASYRIVRLAL